MKGHHLELREQASASAAWGDSVTVSQEKGRKANTLMYILESSPHSWNKSSPAANGTCKRKGRIPARRAVALYGYARENILQAWSPPPLCFLAASTVGLLVGTERLRTPTPNTLFPSDLVSGTGHQCDRHSKFRLPPYWTATSHDSFTLRANELAH